MGRHRSNEPLDVYLNSRIVGRLIRKTSGAIEFQYSEDIPGLQTVVISLLNYVI